MRSHKATYVYDAVGNLITRFEQGIEKPFSDEERKRFETGPKSTGLTGRLIRFIDTSEESSVIGEGENEECGKDDES